MRIDEKELDQKSKKQFEEVEKFLTKEFKGKKHILGMCHSIWYRKKRLLKEMYNIDWISPKELNPGIIFD